MSYIPLGVLVRDKVTGFTGVAENKADYLYGCTRYCVQPEVDKDGKLPEAEMIDEPQLEVIEEGGFRMNPKTPPPARFKFGQVVTDPIKETEGTVCGRAVYLNGCARIWVLPSLVKKNKDDGWWVDEERLVPKKNFLGKIVMKIKQLPKDKTSGGPAPSSSKY